MRAIDIMNREVITLGPETSVSHAARILLEHRISGAPVIDDAGHLVGMLTEGDLLRRTELGSADGIDPVSWEGLSAFIRARSWSVADAMTQPVFSVEENTPVIEVAQELRSRKIKRLPVLREGRVVGIVSRTDILECLTQTRPDPIAGGDAALHLSVVARLRQALGAAMILPDVSVADGVVHLRGAVRADIDRRAIRVVIEGIAGIRGIEDHMACDGDSAVNAPPPA